MLATVYTNFGFCAFFPMRSCSQKVAHVQLPNDSLIVSLPAHVRRAHDHFECRSATERESRLKQFYIALALPLG